MKRINVNVTFHDIKNGVRKCAENCPVNIALRRAVNQGNTGQPIDTSIMVNYARVGLDDPYDDRIQAGYYGVPEGIQNWIRDYDAGVNVPPIRFFLSRPAF
jgi:hypothetical protein